MTNGAFDAFLQGIFDLYNALAKERNREYVVSKSRHILRVLRHHEPRDESEEINIEVLVEMFEDLIRGAGGTP
jgi:hypothetical protein